jgi:hypothetical protein
MAELPKGAQLGLFYSLYIINSTIDQMLPAISYDHLVRYLRTTNVFLHQTIKKQTTDSGPTTVKPELIEIEFKMR